MNKIDTSATLRPGTELHNGPLTYRIDHPISSGGFGNTYVARQFDAFDRELRIVALKEFFMRGITERTEDTATIRVSNQDNIKQFEEQKEKLLKEAKRLSLMKSPYIVKVIDLFKANGTVYYAMEFINGKSVEEIVKETGELFEDDVRHILPQMLDALAEVHKRGFQHLDIKPANIMIRNDGGDAVLIDFGASKQLNADGSAATATGLAFTAGYAPREQMEQNLEKFGPWTDLYALGATLYRSLTAQKPPMPSDIEEDREEALTFHDGISLPMRKLIFWLMSPRRGDRPQTVEEVQKYVHDNGLDTEIGAGIPDVPVANSPAMSQPATDYAVNNEPKPDSITQNDYAPISQPVPSQPVPSQPLPTDNSQPVFASQPPRDEMAANMASGALYSNDDEDDSPKKNKTLPIIIGILALILLCGGGTWWFLSKDKKPAENNTTALTSTSAQSTSAQTVTDKEFTNAVLGKYKYTGPVDEKGEPDGTGKATFSDGSSYDGPFAHGTFEGEKATYTTANGDTFEGTFKNNLYDKGKYTVKATGEYFDGTFDGGDTKQGKWFDKQGNVLEELK